MDGGRVLAETMPDDVKDQAGLPLPDAAARPWIAEAERVIRREGIRPNQEPILQRLKTDPLMDGVWKELTRRSRSDPSRFFYPATRQSHDDPEQSAEKAQERALGMLLLVAYQAAAERRQATKIEEVQAEQQRRRDEAETLRRVADKIGAWVVSAGAHDRAHNDMVRIIMDVQAVRRMADRHEANAAAWREPADPLTITYDRPDAIAAGVQITIAEFLRDCFGKPLHAQAAIICVVALGLAQVPSERVSRFAILEAKKRAKRRSAN